MTALLAFLTTIAFCIAAFFLMRGATASLREDMKAAFGVLNSDVGRAAKTVAKLV